MENKDVMIGQTDRAVYQIWQGKSGNYTRFVNHSCAPNSQFERFVWLGKQRIVLVSKGVEAGEEITVDYSDTYWKVSFPPPPLFSIRCDGLQRLTDFFFGCFRTSTRSVYAKVPNVDIGDNLNS